MTFRVRRADRDVAEFSDGAGIVSSVALPPPGTPPFVHPWLHGRSLDGAWESELRDLLLGSSDLRSFVRALRDGGYAVVFTD